VNSDVELETWRRLWRSRSDPLSVADLKRRVDRQTRWMMVWMIAPVLVSIVLGGSVLLYARQSHSLAGFVLAFGVWALIASAWASCMTVAAGTWRPSSEATAAFLDLAVRRCESALRGGLWGMGIYVTLLVFVLVWQLAFSPMSWLRVVTSWPVILLGWLGVPVVVGGTLWYRSVKQAELACLQRVRRQFAETPEQPEV